MRDFLKKLFSETGEVSFGRVGAFLALIAAIVWISHVVIKTHALPALDGITLFVTSLFGVGKGSETIQKVFGPKPPGA